MSLRIDHEPSRHLTVMNSPLKMRSCVTWPSSRCLETSSLLVSTLCRWKWIELEALRCFDSHELGPEDQERYDLAVNSWCICTIYMLGLQLKYKYKSGQSVMSSKCVLLALSYNMLIHLCVWAGFVQKIVFSSTDFFIWFIWFIIKPSFTILFVFYLLIRWTWQVGNAPWINPVQVH